VASPSRAPALLERNRKHRFSELDLQQITPHHADAGVHDLLHEPLAHRVQRLTFDERLDHEARVDGERVGQEQ